MVIIDGCSVFSEVGCKLSMSLHCFMRKFDLIAKLERSESQLSVNIYNLIYLFVHLQPLRIRDHFQHVITWIMLFVIRVRISEFCFSFSEDHGVITCKT